MRLPLGIRPPAGMRLPSAFDRPPRRHQVQARCEGPSRCPISSTNSYMEMELATASIRPGAVFSVGARSNPPRAAMRVAKMGRTSLFGDASVPHGRTHPTSGATASTRDGGLPGGLDVFEEGVGVAEVEGGGCVEGFDLGVAEGDVFGFDVVFELLDVASAKDDGADLGLIEEPSERDCGGRAAELAGDGGHGVEDAPVALVVEAGHAVLPLFEARAGRGGLIFAVFAAQE